MDVIGQMRHRVEIYAITSTIDNDYGGETGYTESLHSTVWAAWQPKETKSGEAVEADQKEEMNTVNWIIRYDSAVTTEMFLKYEGLYYNILSALPDSHRAYMTLETEQVGDNWTKT